MPKKIILLADGTGNSAAKAFKTNVWRLYEALDLQGQEQIATFSDGVGTSSFRPLQVVGLALGFGVKKRVINLYKFLCLNYRPGDKIYVFGFSRGAFIARLLVGLVFREGLVNFQSHEELNRNAVAAYRSFRAAAFKATQPWTRWGRRLRDAVVSKWNDVSGSRQYEEARPPSGDPLSGEEMRIAFLGVWDTVSAYGLPIDELTRAVDRWIWPLTFEKKDLLPCVERARQVLSIDDERRTFFPIAWDALNPPDPTRLQQVWFAGVHSNVGGGYPDDRLAYVPLLWMISEAERAGLKFKPVLLAQYEAVASEDGRIYDSRANFGFFYRYHPRSAHRLMQDTPLVDSSVILRMADGPDGYAPISLTRDFDVLMPDGSRVPFLNGSCHQPNSEEAELRSRAQIQAESALFALRKRLSGSRDMRDKSAEIMLDTVWWRRAVYYLLLTVLIIAAAYPLFFEYVSVDVLTKIENGARPIVGSFIGLLEMVTPGFAKPWLNAMARAPGLAAILLATLAGLMWLSAFLRIHIADRARIFWGSGRWRRDLTVLEAERRKSRKRTAVGGATATGIAALALLVAGNNWAAGVLAVTFGGFLAYWNMQKRARTESQSVLLRFARFMRTNRTTVAIYHLLKNTVFPMTSLVAVGLLCVVLANRYAFEIRNARGAFCSEDNRNEETKEIVGQVERSFDLKSLCWDTGKVLLKGERYRITISIPAGTEWRDGKNVSGAAGFKWTSDRKWYDLGTVALAATVPLRRWWGYPYFQPTARIGRHGADEQPLAPIRLLSDTRPAENKASALTEAKFLLTPKENGRLYLYVNDAVLGIPGLHSFFYKNNDGSATVSIENVSGY